MYDITKTRMLLTTAVLAAVAVVFASGANARALAEDGSGLDAVPAAQATQLSRTFWVDEICGALEVEQLRGVLINEAAIKAATPVAIQECSVVQAHVVSRYLDINRTSTSQKRPRGPGPTSTPTAAAAVPRRRATSRVEDGATAAPSSRRRGCVTSRLRRSRSSWSLSLATGQLSDSVLNHPRIRPLPEDNRPPRPAAILDAVAVTTRRGCRLSVAVEWSPPPIRWTVVVVWRSLDAQLAEVADELQTLGAAFGRQRALPASTTSLPRAQRPPSLRKRSSSSLTPRNCGWPRTR